MHWCTSRIANFIVISLDWHHSVILWHHTIDDGCVHSTNPDGQLDWQHHITSTCIMHHHGWSWLQTCAPSSHYKAMLCTTKVYVGTEVHCGPWFACREWPLLLTDIGPCVHYGAQRRLVVHNVVLCHWGGAQHSSHKVSQTYKQDQFYYLKGSCTKFQIVPICLLQFKGELTLSTMLLTMHHCEVPHDGG